MLNAKSKKGNINTITPPALQPALAGAHSALPSIGPHMPKRLPDMADEINPQTLFDLIRKVPRVLPVTFGQKHALDARAHSTDELLLDAADRQHPSP